MAGQVQVEITANDRTQQGVQSSERRIRGMADQATTDLKRMGQAADAAASALAALGARAALDKVVSVVNSGVEAYNRLRAAQQGVQTVADRMGQSLSGVNQLVEELVRDGLMNQADASAAVKNFLSINASLEQTRTVLLGAKDAAAFNRQEMFSVSEAVRRFSEGVKNGNSAVSDAAGIQKNLTTILKERGFTEQDLQRVQSDAAVRQALLNGLTQEAAIYQGDAARLAGELAGQQARANQEAEKLRATFGEAMAPAVAIANQQGAKWLQTVRLWMEINPEIARGLTTVSAGLLGAAAAATTVAGALGVMVIAVRGLVAATGPIGILVTALTALGGAWLGAKLASESSSYADQQRAQQTYDLMRRYEALRTVVDDTASSTDQKAKAVDKLRDVTQQLIDLQPGLVTAFDAEGRLVSGQADKYKELRDAVEEVTRAKLKAQIIEAEQQLQTIEGQVANVAAKHDARTLQGFLEVLFDPKQAGAKTPAEVRAIIEENIKNDPALRKIEAERVLAQAQLNAAQKALESLDKPLSTAQVLPPPPGGNPPPDVTKMSDALRAAMEDLQDLQALEKSPENLKRTLDKVRAILQEHGAELAKMDRARDLVRLRDIALPKEITQAEFTAAMRSLQNEEQLAQAKGAPLEPGVIRSRSESIKAQFADYLKSNPDAAASIDIRLAGIEPDEIRQKVKAAIDAIEQQKKLFGESYTPTMERAALAAILPIAATLPGTEGSGQVGDILDRIHRLDGEIKSARFEEKFAAIGKAFENAQVLVAGSLADMEKQLITEEAKGDKTDPKVIESIKLRILNAVKPALEARKAALEGLLEDTTLTGEQRAQVERELNDVKQTLYSKDVDAHRIATEANVAVERNAKEARTKLEREVQDDIQKARREAAQALEKAERDQLDKMKARHKADEDAAEAAIKAKERELQLFERQIAAEERLKKIRDAQAEIDRLNREGEREQVLIGTGPDGKPIWETRIRGMREAQNALAAAIKDDSEARRKEQLQEEINAMRQSLDSLRSSHRAKEEELSKHFDAAKTILENGFAGLTDAQVEKVQDMAKALGTELTKALGPWATYAASVQSILDRIKVPGGTTTTGATGTSVGTTTTATGNTATPIPAGGPRATPPATQTLQDVIGPGLPLPSIPTLPTLPAGLSSGGNVTATVESVVINLQNPTNASPEQIGRAVGPAVNDGVLDAVRRRMTGGTIRRKL